MTPPVKSLFVPAAQADRVDLEAREQTTSGQVTVWGVRARPVLVTYRRRGQLTDRQARAGEKLYRDWSLGVVGSRSPSDEAGVASDLSWEDLRLLHLFAYQRATQSLGKRISPVVIGVACEDRTVEALAKEWGVDRKGLKAVLKLGLDMLADWYRLPE